MKNFLAILIVCFLSFNQSAFACYNVKVLQSISASNTVDPESGTRTYSGDTVIETFNANFDVEATFKSGDTISHENVSSYTCSNWAWAITDGTDPTKVSFVPATQTCDATYSHQAGGGNSIVTIGATVAYTYNGITKDDSSTGNGTFLE